MKRIFIITAGCIYFLACFGINLRSAYGEETKEFKIGVFVCLTGVCADWGSNSLKGIQLAVDELNSSGGILGHKITIRVQDTAEWASGSTSVTAFEKLVQDPEIKYFIGPTWSVGGVPLIPILKRHPEIIITSPSLGVPEFNEAADNIFNVWPHDHFTSVKLAQYAIAQGWKKAAILSNKDSWCIVQGDTFEKEFKRLGGTITTKLEPLPTLTDPKMEITKIKFTEPDLVFFSSYYLLGLGARELRQLGYAGKLMTVLMNEDQLKAAAGAMEGTIFARYPNPTSQFETQYEKRYGTKPAVTADTAYDIVKLYGAAIERSKTFDPHVVKKAMLEIKYSGASGNLEFDATGGVKKEPILFSIVGASSKPLEH